jgi:RNA polymerase sigma-70 factor (ECF subfamily)
MAYSSRHANEAATSLQASVTVPSGAREPGASGLHALEVLFHSHYATLCEYVYHFVRSREAAEDLVQDLFVRLWQLKADAAPGTLAESYLYKAARNRALRYLKHQRVERRWADQAAGDAESTLQTLRAANDPAETHDLTDAIHAAIELLPSRCRLIFLMSREQQLTYGQIAQALEISLSTVETQMGRALKRLRAHLAPFLACMIVPVAAVYTLLASLTVTYQL